MKICTWNINGIRSFKVSVPSLLQHLDCDVICLQETKINKEMLDEKTAFTKGFNSFFSFCKEKSGYSGVLTLVRESIGTLKAEDRLCGSSNDNIGQLPNITEIEEDQLPKLDSEGRAVITQHEILEEDGTTTPLAIINLYCPRVDPDRPDRIDFKANYLHVVETRAIALLKSGFRVIMTGDFNISHRQIDNCDPSPDFDENPSRRWFDRLLQSHFTDTYRQFHPDQAEAYTCWNTAASARVNNYGTRIDFILADHGFLKSTGGCSIYPDIQGSDHCPVVAEFYIKCKAHASLPPLCTKNWKEYAARQKPLQDFFYSTSREKLAAPEQCKPKKPQQSRLTKYLSTDHKSKRMKLTSNSHSDNDLSLLGIRSNSEECMNHWKNLFTSKAEVPLCSGHNEPCVSRMVKKDSLNKGRKFWVCAKPDGKKGTPEARCDFFIWETKKKH